MRNRRGKTGCKYRGERDQEGEEREAFDLERACVVYQARGGTEEMEEEAVKLGTDEEEVEDLY